jgi:hypothetical protein
MKTRQQHDQPTLTGDSDMILSTTAPVENYRVFVKVRNGKEVMSQLMTHYVTGVRIEKMANYMEFRNGEGVRFTSYGVRDGFGVVVGRRIADGNESYQIQHGTKKYWVDGKNMVSDNH